MVSMVEFLHIPLKIALVIIGIFFILQIIGELLEFKGKIVPEFIKIRKYFKRKRKERKEKEETLKNVQILLQDVNSHYSADNIAKRDSWMHWVNNRAEVYDSSIDKLRDTLAEAIQALKDNTKMTEEMFVQSSRDRIIDFATKVSNDSVPVSREEFNRIFKVHAKYEKFLEDHNMTNGEVDINFSIIQEAYQTHLKNHTFVEDIRGYKN